MVLSPRANTMIRIVATLVGLATLSVIIRVAARLKRKVRIGTDDVLCIASLILLFGMLAEAVLWCTIGGNGTRIEELSREEIMNFGKIFIANQFTYFVLTPCLKISIICFYRRLFVGPQFQRATFGLNILISLWAVGIFLACALQCRPLSAYWDRSIDGMCFDANTFFIVNQVFNIIMDFIVLGLPVPMIWGLNRSWKDRVGLMFVFGLGVFVCFASIFRIVVLFYIDPHDTTYTVYHATIWTHVEPAVGLICACLPIIRGLFPQTLRKSSNKSGGTSTRDRIDKIRSSRLSPRLARDSANADYICMVEPPSLIWARDSHEVGDSHELDDVREVKPCSVSSTSTYGGLKGGAAAYAVRPGDAV